MFTQGSELARQITAAASYSETVFTAAGHGIDAGATVALENMDNYSGEHTISEAPSGSELVVQTAFVTGPLQTPQTYSIVSASGSWGTGTRFFLTQSPELAVAAFDVGAYVDITGTTDYDGRWRVSGFSSNKNGVQIADLPFVSAQSGTMTLSAPAIRQLGDPSPITQVSQVSSGDTRSRITITGSHDYAVGDLISISDTTTYDGEHLIQAVGGQTLVIARTFSTTATGNLRRLETLATVSAATEYISGTALTVANHGYSSADRDVVDVSDTTNYDGRWRVLNAIDTDTIAILAPFVASESGSVARIERRVRQRNFDLRAAGSTTILSGASPNDVDRFGRTYCTYNGDYTLLHVGAPVRIANSAVAAWNGLTSIAEVNQSISAIFFDLPFSSINAGNSVSILVGDNGFQNVDNADLEYVTEQRFGSADFPVSWFFFLNCRLNVEGDLLHNPRLQKVVMQDERLEGNDNNDFITVTGRYEYGEPGEVIGEGLVFTTRTRNHWAAYMVAIDDGGEFEWNGGSIIGTNTGVFVQESGGTLRVRDGKVSGSIGSGYQDQNVPGSIGGISGSTLDIEGLSLSGMTRLRAYEEVSDIEFRDGATVTFQPGLILRDCAIDDVAALFAVSWSNSALLQNFREGSNVWCQPGAPDQSMTCEWRREFNIHVTDDGANVADARVWTREWDGITIPRRVGFTLSDGTASDDVQTYTGITGANGRLATDFNILTAFQNVASNAPFPYPFGVADGLFDTNARDLRGRSASVLSNQNTDTFDVSVVSYPHTINVQAVDLVGTGVRQATAQLIVDPSVTEADRAVVDAYTDLNTSARLYDRLKSWLVDNYDGESEPLVEFAGAALDLGTRNLTIDATSTDVLAFDATGDLTIRASTFTSPLRLTGTISMVNGAVMAASFRDANGQTAAVDIGVSDINGAVAGARYRMASSEATPTIYAGATMADGTSGTFAVRIREGGVWLGQAMMEWDVAVFSYAHQLSTLRTALSAEAANAPTFLLMADADITETKATIDGRTELTTAAHVYDAAKSYLSDNYAGESAVLVTRSGDAIDFGARDVTLSGVASAPIAFAADGAVTIRTSTFTSPILTTGIVSLVGGATTSAQITDATGTTAAVSLTTPDALATMALFAASGTLRAWGSGGSISASLTPSQIESGMRAVCARPGYTPQVRTLDTSAGGVFVEAFLAPVRELLPNGDVMLSGSVSPDVSVVHDTSDLTDPQMRIDIADAQVGVQVCYLEVETVSVVQSGLRYLAFGGGRCGINLSPTAGNELYLDAGVQLRRASAGDSNAGVRGTVFHPTNTPIDDTNGGIAIAGGVDLETLQRALLEDWDIDPDTAGTQSIAGHLTAVHNEVDSLVFDVEQGPASLESILAGVQAIGDGILAADIDPTTAGTQTFAGQLMTAATQAAVAASAATDAASDATAALQAITAAAAEVESGVSVQEALRQLLAGLLGRADIHGDTVTFRRIDSAATPVRVVTVGDDGARTGSDAV